MATGVSPILFSPEQREQIAKLGVSDRQIAELENKACPLGKLFLVKPRRVADVRDRISGICGQLRKGQASLSEMLKGNITEERKEALLRLCDAAVRLGWYQMIEQAPARRDQLSRICDEATAGLPNQSRHQLATPRPVQLVWRALIKAHDRTPDAQGRTPANQIHLSWAPKSEFRRIVSICYQAMTGRKKVDPERAIKTFVKWERAREDRQRDDIGIKEDLAALGVSTPSRTRGRPRKTMTARQK